MKYWKINLFALFIIVFGACKEDETPLPTTDENFNIIAASATYNADLEQIVMRMDVANLAGATLPNPIGQLDGAPVLGYVFPTTLNSVDVGFGNTDGIVAMALTSHPDFDDTPLWDENTDGDYANDGLVWHPHWVLLVEDVRVEGGFSVKQFEAGDSTVVLPPTNPGMPMYMDSPGYQTITEGTTISVVIPSAFVNGRTDFNFDALTARLKVNTSNVDLPLLGVYEVYKVLSEDLSLPFSVR